MRDLTFEQSGRKKRTERALSVNCHVCNTSIDCPPDKDFWAWLKCGDVLDFYKAHEHGNPRSTGAEIKAVEKDD
jgi:hypothetical protein